MNILIIGSKGFIGKALRRYFNENTDFNVIECDIAVDHGNPNYYQLDPSNPSFDFPFKNGAFSFCVNCSGAANVNESISFPAKDYFLNSVNVFRMLDAIRIYQPECRFINLSSAAVYGNPRQLPIDEMTPSVPISPYGYHKMHAEAICKEFTDLFGLKTLSLRIFSAFGNGLKKQIFWDMYEKSIESDKITLYGTGLETRDFIHVDDLVAAIHLCMLQASFSAESINLANGEEVTIREIAEIFISEVGMEKEVEFNGVVNKGNPNYWCADISKLKSLGYQRRVSMKAGIASYCEWAQTTIHNL